MKLTLGMIVKNEEFFLSKILPSTYKFFDEIVAVDAESTDATRDILAKHKAKVTIRPWTNDYSAARNAVMQMGTGDWMFMMDADEALFGADLLKLRRRIAALKTPNLVMLPRIEFVSDFKHYDDRCYPDWQGRIFSLKGPYEFRNKVHEIMYRKGEESSEYEHGRYVKYHDTPIYHYGQCKPPEVTWLRHHNYNLVMRGETPIKEVPPGVEIKPRTGLKLFTEKHPLA